MKIKCEEAKKKHLKDFQERTLKLWAFEDAKKERENKIFIERVVQEARRIRKREEEEEERKGSLLDTIEICKLRFGCGL